MMRGTFFGAALCVLLAASVSLDAGIDRCASAVHRPVLFVIEGSDGETLSRVNGKSAARGVTASIDRAFHLCAPC